MTNYKVRRRTGQPLLSDTVRTRRLKLFKFLWPRWPKSQDHSCALQACISPAPINRRRRPGRPKHSWLRTVEEDLRHFNLGLAPGFGEHKTEQLGGQSLEQQRHRQAPIDDDGCPVTATGTGFQKSVLSHLAYYSNRTGSTCVVSPRLLTCFDTTHAGCHAILVITRVCCCC